MTCIYAKFIPTLLMAEQKTFRLELADDNLEMFLDIENVIKKVIAGD